MTQKEIVKSLIKNTKFKLKDIRSYAKQFEDEINDILVWACLDLLKYEYVSELEELLPPCDETENLLFELENHNLPYYKNELDYGYENNEELLNTILKRFKRV